MTWRSYVHCPNTRAPPSTAIPHKPCRCARGASVLQVMRTWLQPSMFEADPFTPPTVFNEAAFRQARRLRIGIMHNDRFFEPSPSCSRAVHEAADALRAAGHDVIDWDPNTRGVDTYQAALLYFKILAADGKLDGFIQGLEGEGVRTYL
ncbi:hypothetical protein EON66_10195 [archaeon]|nr:MAG: hypothetical protein EON66_10195 [archaeon]